MSGGFVMGFDAVVVPPDAGQSVLQQRIAELVAKHGDVRAAARVLQVDHAYLYRLLSGEKSNPGGKLLRKLKLRRVVTYERTDGRHQEAVRFGSSPHTAGPTGAHAGPDLPSPRRITPTETDCSGGEPCAVGINGLTEAETNATASVAGIVGTKE